jgi:hypothetical protein
MTQRKKKWTLTKEGQDGRASRAQTLREQACGSARGRARAHAHILTHMHARMCVGRVGLKLKTGRGSEGERGQGWGGGVGWRGDVREDRGREGGREEGEGARRGRES